MRTCRGWRVPASVMRSTCAMTMPPELCAAVAEMIQTALLAVPLPGGVNQSQVAGLAGLHESLFEGDGEFLGETDTHEAAGSQGVATTNQLHRLRPSDHLIAPLHGLGRTSCEGVFLLHFSALVYHLFNYHAFPSQLLWRSATNT